MNTMNTTDVSTIIENGLVTYSSIAAIRDAHNQLVLSHRRLGDTTIFLDQAENFIKKVQATGILLDTDDDRWACQSLVDYWANTLVRAGRETPDATLAAFDAKIAFGLDISECPYRGLNTFQEKDRHLFYGRQKLVSFLANQLVEDRFLALIGPSGSGKSSLVLAGLIPALKEGTLPGSQNWKYYDRMVPGSDPLANLAQILKPSTITADEWRLAQTTHFRQDEGYLRSLADGQYQAKGQSKEEGNAAKVIVVDQFEELFTLCLDENIRNALVNNLRCLIEPKPLFNIQLDFAKELDASHVSIELCAKFKENDRNLSSQAEVIVQPTEGKWTIVDAGTKYLVQKGSETLSVYQISKHTVILTMRSDFRSFVTKLPTFQGLFDKACVWVTPLEPAELNAVIEKPACLVGLEFESGVIDAIVREALGEPSPLPLVQFTLLKLWEIWKNDKKPITMAAYNDLGGVPNALAYSADKFYQALNREEKLVAERILLKMVK